jgi:hypothetical protein
MSTLKNLILGNFVETKFLTFGAKASPTLQEVVEKYNKTIVLVVKILCRFSSDVMD